jgi:hypothetical protein
MEETMATTRELGKIISELSAFLGGELGQPTDTFATARVDRLAELWDRIQENDPDPSPKASDYIGGVDLGMVADRVLAEMGR